MKQKIIKFLLLGLLIALAYSYFNEGEAVILDGKKYPFVRYEVNPHDLTFSRSDPNPSLLNKYKWIGAASLSYGSVFLRDLSEAELSRYFESPPPDPRRAVSSILGEGQPMGDISVISAEKFQINGEWFLYVGIKRSDFPKGVKFCKLARRDGNWVLADGRRDPNGDIIKLLDKLSNEVNRMESFGKINKKSISRL